MSFHQLLGKGGTQTNYIHRQIVLGKAKEREMNTQRLFQSIQSMIQGWRDSKRQIRLIDVLILGLLSILILTVGTSRAQELDEEDTNQESGAAAAASVNSIIPIQGKLTDAQGNPLNGNFNVGARIYDVDTGGTRLCEDVDYLTVENGLFNMDMDYCSPWDIDGRQLYLGITVDSDPEMTPRQPIYPVPYAWTVKPGAIIKGGTTYLFTPGSAFNKYDSSDSTRWVMHGGSAKIYRGATPGYKYIFIPITLPSILYGQNVRVTDVKIFYMNQNGANNYITHTYLYKHTDANNWVGLVSDATDQVSDTATSYSLATNPSYNTLFTNQGVLTLRLQLAFANNTEYVMINGVRLTLETNY
jgi:hypothetical protein